MLINKVKKLKGQSLVEIVISIGLASLVLTALVILGSASVKTSTSSINRAEASKLAASGIEGVRYLRDEFGFTYIPIDTCYMIEGSAISEDTDADCSDPDFNDPQGWDEVLNADGSASIFERKIKVQSYGDSEGLDEDDVQLKKVTSVVRWPEGLGETIDGETYRKVEISTVFTRWRN